MSRVEPERNKYVGHRYVPKIFGEWDKKNEYEGLSIVTHQGTSYTSKKRVPVGIDILNEEYWVVTGNYDAQVEEYRKETRRVSDELVNKADKTQLIQLKKDVNDDITNFKTDVNEDITTFKTETNEEINTRFKEFSTYSPENEKVFYVNSYEGSYKGDGSQENPYRSLQNVVDHMSTLSSVKISSPIRIKMSGVFTEGIEIYSLPYLKDILIIEGDTDVDGKPSTFIDGTNSNRRIGLRIEQVPATKIKIENLAFTNWKTDDKNGHGFIYKTGGYVYLNNCKAENCDLGFVVTNNATGILEKCHAIDCWSGFRGQYSSTVTFGRNLSEGKSTNAYACTALNCTTGFFVSRNCVAHIDFSIIDGCSYSGVHVDMSSRVNITGGSIKNNAEGIKIEGGAEWIDNTYASTFENNEINYRHYGSGRETRLHSQLGANEYRLTQQLKSVTNTGTTERVNIYTFGSLGEIPGTFFHDSHKRLKLRVLGVIEKGTGNKNLSFYVTNTDGSNSQSLGNIQTSDNYGTFEYIVEIIPTSNKTQITNHKLLSQGEPPIMTLTTKNIDFTVPKQFRLMSENTEIDDEIRFEIAEMYIMG